MLLGALVETKRAHCIHLMTFMLLLYILKDSMEEKIENERQN